MKHVIKITPTALPDQIEEIFNRINAAGYTHYALFGGAVRDAEYNARHDAKIPIKDYDIRIWIGETENQFQILNTLDAAFGVKFEMIPSAGTGRLRYCAIFNGTEIDISVRQMSINSLLPRAVAIERAQDSDIGISSCAVDPALNVWVLRAFTDDQSNKTLSVFDISDLGRQQAYLDRMQQKFPDHEIKFMPSRNKNNGVK